MGQESAEEVAVHLGVKEIFDSARTLKGVNDCQISLMYHS